MSHFKIEPCEKNNIAPIIEGINSYNLSKVAALSPTWNPLDFVIKNESGNEIAGILAGIGYWNGLEIKILWVDENYRKKGLGTKLLQHLEKIAKEKGVTVAMLDTFDFQAEEFYIKNGYLSIGEVKNFPSGHRRIYFSKRLT